MCGCMIRKLGWWLVLVGVCAAMQRCHVENAATECMWLCANAVGTGACLSDDVVVCFAFSFAFPHASLPIYLSMSVCLRSSVSRSVEASGA